MSKNNENCPISVSIHLGSLTTDGTTVPALYLPKASKIVSAVLMNGAAVAASNSNYCGVALKQGSTSIAALDTRAAHENGLEANVGKALVLDADEATLDDEASLSVVYSETGTVALTDAKLVLTYFPL